MNFYEYIQNGSGTLALTNFLFAALRAVCGLLLNDLPW